MKCHLESFLGVKIFEGGGANFRGPPCINSNLIFPPCENKGNFSESFRGELENSSKLSVFVESLMVWQTFHFPMAFEKLAKRRASPGYARDHGFGSSGIFWGNLFCLDFTDDSLFTKIFLCIV